MDPCQNNFQDLTRIGATLSDTHMALRRHWCDLQDLIWLMNVLGPRWVASRLRRRIFSRLGKFAPTDKRKLGPRFNTATDDLNLQPGELVEVKTLKAIFATLDEKQKLKGLLFFREMWKFTGKRFRVYKRLDKIIMETTGELKKVKMPTVLLEGVICDGSYHGGCDRSCFCFWREAWLKKVIPDISSRDGGEPVG